MSRIGRLPITIPSGVSVEIKGSEVTVKGSKGQLTRTFHPDMKIEMNEEILSVSRPSDKKEHRALHGLTRALVNNMVVGVNSGFEKKLEINGVGYRAQKQGNKLTLALGYSHPVEMIDPEGIDTVVEGTTKITISGISKEEVGRHAANIRSKRPPEPYKGKGIKYADEVIRRKEGKTGK
ncbi:50S ribosomal protein L6 [Alkalibaculum sp. M08DMB]|uniref:Large ribosomal subunit protein uL6 n=1 Tax=Alkalibaculum sporogenes TaxID=2655001 RepID=A0A6A7K6P4_9FIRM|nr:50S ribosomal protein L6 [Alkalibaculum sporogenes]MPW25012.1 50S ribosomal protein L6 [Alkalibaculum sporogenes]